MVASLGRREGIGEKGNSHCREERKGSAPTWGDCDTSTDRLPRKIGGGKARDVGRETLRDLKKKRRRKERCEREGRKTEKKGNHKDGGRGDRTLPTCEGRRIGAPMGTS